MISANPPLSMISLIQVFGNIRAANTGLIPKTLHICNFTLSSSYSIYPSVFFTSTP